VHFGIISSKVSEESFFEDRDFYFKKRLPNKVDSRG
jgi:hypothetical protein